MSGERGDGKADIVRQAAAEWFVRLQDEAADEADWAAFETWLATDPAHGRTYEAIERLWIEIDEMGPAAAAALFPAAPAPVAPFRRPMSPPRRALLMAGAGLAAALAVAVVELNRTAEPPAQVFVTAPGQTRQVALADGTKVWLNAATRLQVRLRRSDREVRMDEGEAVFDVAHDPARPFLIAVGDRQVRVVGTQFDLRRREGQMALTVSRGVVEVRPAGDVQAAPTRVTAGQRLVHREGQPLNLVSPAQPEAAFAWTQGRLVYQNAPLTEVAADLSVSLGKPIRVADNATGDLRFTGVLTLDDREAVLRRLEAFAPVTAKPQDGGYLLRRR